MGGYLDAISGSIPFPLRDLSGLRAWAYLCFVATFFTTSFGTSPPLILAALGTILCIFTMNKTKLKTLIREKWFVPCIIIIALNWLGILYTSDTEGLAIKFASKSYYWLFAFSLIMTIEDESEARFLIYIFLLGIFINAIVGFLQFCGIIPTKQSWFSGLERGYNSLTLYLILGMLISSFFFKTTTRYQLRYLYCITGATYFLHLVILEGRTGYFVFLFSLPVILRNFINRKNYKIALLITLSIVIVFFLSPVVQKRLLLTVNELRYHTNGPADKVWGREYTSYQDRFYMWYGALELMAKNPFLGVGTGGYGSALKALRGGTDPFISHPHNNFLYALVSFGLLGFVFYVWFFIALLKFSWARRKSSVHVFIIYSLSVLILGGFFNTTLLDSGSLLLLVLTVGLCKDYNTGNLSP